MPDMEFFAQRPAVVPQIYAYTLPDVTTHQGYIKVGYTEREDVNERIRVHLHTSAVRYKLLFTASAMRSDGTCFTDHDIHAILRRRGFPHIFDEDNEWFKCSESDVQAAIVAVRDEIENIENRTETFSMRPEQVRAVQMTMDYYQKTHAEEPNMVPKFLWNAKMRVG